MLAGGPAAAGADVVDAHGNPVVAPASYCSPYGCPPGGAGFGDPMAMDFSAYGHAADQIGPHYFDVAIETVFLTEEELFGNLPAFAATIDPGGAVTEYFLIADDYDNEYDAGWRITGRYDLGPLSVFEIGYQGMYDVGFSQTAVSTQGFELFSMFSDYGNDPAGGILGLEPANSVNLRYSAKLQGAELNYRRYWVGFGPRVTGTFLMGFRYFRLDENLMFNTVIAGVNPPPALDEASRTWSGSNDLLGFQIGGDGWLGLRQGLRLGLESKVGLYNNRIDFRHIGSFPAGGDLDSFNVETSDDHVAFAAEARMMMVADILPSLSIRLGYEALYMNNLATVAGNVDPSDITSTAVLATDDGLWHGFNGGIEYVW